MTEGDLLGPLYSTEDKAKLRAWWYDPMITTPEIARRLGRTVSAVRVKAVSMKLGRRAPEQSFGVHRRRKAAQ